MYHVLCFYIAVLVETLYIHSLSLTHTHTLKLLHIQCIAYIAAAELPANQSPDVVKNLLANVSAVPPNTEAVKEASLEAIGYICEELVSSLVDVCELCARCIVCECMLFHITLCNSHLSPSYVVVCVTILSYTMYILYTCCIGSCYPGSTGQ